MIPRRKVVPYATGFVLGCLILFLLPERKISREPHPWHAQTAPEGTYPLEVVDDYGRTVRLEKQPRYFISLAPGITQLLHAMELGDHLMAVTEWCDTPAEAKALRDAGAHVGRIDQPDRERIAAYSPDLIIASNLTPPEVLDAISQPPRTLAIALEHTSFEDLLEDIKTIGRATGVPGKAVRLLAHLRAARQATLDAMALAGVDQLPPKRALFLLSIEENAQPGWAPGSGVWVTELIEAANGTNLASAIGSSWGEVSLETLLLLNPEVILLRRAETDEAQARLEKIVANLPRHPVWQQVEAIQTGRIEWLPYAPLTIPGPLMADAFSAIATALWPELKEHQAPPSAAAKREDATQVGQ
jgi:iron complex transport system substrate-binding protein